MLNIKSGFNVYCNIFSSKNAYITILFISIIIYINTNNQHTLLNGGMEPGAIPPTSA